MGHRLGLGDTLRLLLLTPFGGRNLAVTRDNIAGWPTFNSNLALRKVVLSRRARCTAVSWDGPMLACMASARTRRGPGAWEVDHLYLPRGDAEVLTRTLELLTRRAGEQGARRIFLRVASGGTVEEYARQAGFLPSYEESLLEGNGPGLKASQPDDVVIGAAEALHQQGLFQLYSASTPPAVRQATGMTLNEWEESREGGAVKDEETVFEVGGKVRGWVALTPRGGAFQGQVMVHPDEAALLPHLVVRCLSRRGRYLWLVPDYQDSLLSLLSNQGFKEVGGYTMLIKTVTVRVKEPSWAAMEVPG